MYIECKKFIVQELFAPEFSVQGRFNFVDDVDGHSGVEAAHCVCSVFEGWAFVRGTDQYGATPAMVPV